MLDIMEELLFCPKLLRYKNCSRENIIVLCRREFHSILVRISLSVGYDGSGVYCVNNC